MPTFALEDASTLFDGPRQFLMNRSLNRELEVDPVRTIGHGAFPTEEAGFFVRLKLGSLDWYLGSRLHAETGCRKVDAGEVSE